MSIDYIRLAHEHGLGKGGIEEIERIWARTSLPSTSDSPWETTWRARWGMPSGSGRSRQSRSSSSGHGSFTSSSSALTSTTISILVALEGQKIAARPCTQHEVGEAVLFLWRIRRKTLCCHRLFGSGLITGWPSYNRKQKQNRVLSTAATAAVGEEPLCFSPCLFCGSCR